MKTITKEELHKVLEEHKLWLDSNSEEGAKADLSYTILRNANLVDADLRSANLRGAVLRYADLEDTNLRGAILKGADLTRANLTDSRLNEANLEYADLTNTNLTDAKLSQASTQNIKGLKVYSIDNIGTFNGKVTYIPSLDRVYAGCWIGSLEAFLEKGLEMNEGNNSKLEEIRDAYCFFSKRK
ncbi:pentapeptide repeat family protein [Staphylococcus phage LSA2308]|nr:pentapeptide repeat family protein [Staphylococcus phage LSA2308]USZ62980.1 putative pentapeptide repeat protein [Staphylococcus phage LSA2311]